MWLHHVSRPPAAVVGMTATPLLAAALDENLVALFAAIVATSVFTIGLVGHRMHMTLADAKRRVHDRPEPELHRHEFEILRAVASGAVLGVNIALMAILVVVAGFVLVAKEGLTTEEKTVLFGFILVEMTVVFAGWYDQRRAIRKLPPP